MRKFTTIIAVTLLAALLFTGCDFIPMKQDFSQYGFSFTIAGKVTEEAGNEAGKAILNTKYGKMSFIQISPFNLTVTETLISSTCDSKETLSNGARFYLYNSKNSDGVAIIETYYFVGATDGSTWQISLATPADAYDRDAILKIFESAEFLAI